MRDELEGMSVQAIMTRWPRTVRVFIDRRFHCVGCPIAGFHRIADTAREHGHPDEELAEALRLAAGASGLSSGPPPRHRRSAAGGVDP
jgi:hybrid cluster-associated redox disulfide protein